MSGYLSLCCLWFDLFFILQLPVFVLTLTRAEPFQSVTIKVSVMELLTTSHDLHEQHFVVTLFKVALGATRGH